MERNLSENIKINIKRLGYYQIIGGVIGLGLAFRELFKVVPTSRSILLVIIFVGLFVFSLICGLQLLRGKLNSGLKLSSINQILQLFYFGVAGYSYKYVAGILISPCVDFTDGLDFRTIFSLPAFHVDLNSNRQEFFVGINIIAVYLVYYIDKLQKLTELNEELRETYKLELIDSKNILKCLGFFLLQFISHVLFLKYSDQGYQHVDKFYHNFLVLFFFQLLCLGGSLMYCLKSKNKRFKIIYIIIFTIYTLLFLIWTFILFFFRMPDRWI